MEYKGFTIRDYGWGFRVFGTRRDTMRFGYVGAFESVREAQEWIDRFIG